MSSSQPTPASPLVDALPLTRRLLGARTLDARALPYGGALPALAPTWRAAIAAELGADVVHDPGAPDPLASRVFGILYSRLRAEQVVRALSARTNLTLAGSTVRVVGDGPLAGALTALLRRLGAGVVRATDDPVERLEAVLDGLRVERTDAPRALVHATLLTGLGHDGLVATALEGLVADASPRPVDAADAPSPRPHVRSIAKGSLVEMPSPLPTDTEAPTSAQRRLLDALVAALIVDGGPDDARGVFAEAVTP
ncbi:hypothetical protein SAMN04487848_2570 [Microbacterium sp. ru370.1]|uniref:hypothetical protein n=1 Tax=unclassified Microbacterium TaxID=2609290 RepID=UPI0008845996|nr:MULTISPECIES: hypothetical protein [unclassified Microbacterium]SDO92895.1 hypothetical protein SAMN04487848_2570 [Microbacterium sp. ru370.1]SIT93288.1 hypothetical protein SAMN05880579_3008 [Microbacterium sp. RU1D]